MRRALLLALVAALLVPAGTGAKMRRDEQVRIVPASHPGKPQQRPTQRPPVTDPRPAPKPLARLQVVAREFTLTLSRGAVAAGRVAVELDNFGQDPHDLRVERTTDPSTGFNFTLAKPRTVSSRRLDLGPGTWKLFCTLPGHEALGMSATVTVGG
jgi:hypothetical protein